MLSFLPIIPEILPIMLECLNFLHVKVCTQKFFEQSTLAMASTSGDETRSGTGVVWERD